MKRIDLITLIFITGFFSCNSSSNNEKVKSTNSSVTATDILNTDSGNKGKHTTEWEIDYNNSRVNFTIKNFGALVHGTLGGLKGNIYFNEKNLERSSFNASVRVNTIKTGINKRDKDLMHEKYLDDEKYPEIIFRSDKITKADSGYIATGKLTLKGKSMLREIPFNFSQNGDAGIFTSQFSFKRLDYEIGGNGPIMGEDVNVSLKVVADRTK